MLDAAFIRENLDAVKANCANRGVRADVDRVVQLDDERRRLAQETQRIQQRQNEVSKLIPKEKDAAKKQELIAEGKALREQAGGLEKQQKQAQEDLRAALLTIPNMTHPDAPVSRDPAGNKVIRTWGEPRKFDFPPKDHVALAEALDLVDFEAGASVAGQKFYFLKNEAALLELALVQYAMQTLVKEGYTPVITPDVARVEVLEGIGFIPRDPNPETRQVYTIADTDLCLIATAEITLGGMHRDHIFDELDLPKKYVGLSHCFRTEAEDPRTRPTQACYRVHQFTKVEMFAFCAPDQSEQIHLELLAIEEKVFQGLGLPYHVIDTCTGDLGGPAYRKYDLEAWMPGRGKGGEYGEVTSTSNCTDYQARRLGVRYRTAGQKGTRFVHTLNGTAVAVTRAILAILENGQQADGSVVVPDVLRPWLKAGTASARGTAASIPDKNALHKEPNPAMLTLAKYSVGVGDRFAHQAKAQLRACMMAAEKGVEVIPVWNKSHREHTTIGSAQPTAVRKAADAAVKEMGWAKPYHVDADHIRMETVYGFLTSIDFYTIDVADAIGRPPSADTVKAFADRHADLVGRLEIPGIEQPLPTTRADVERTAGKFLSAVLEAGRIYRRIADAKGAGTFITEVSMDETDSPQTPPELLVILAAIADEGIPIQTIAPKFTGRFNKGVDYVGAVTQFEKEFRQDLAVIAFAVKKFGLRANLKLSDHSGSDKFSLYAPIRRGAAKSGAGVHLKTAGTTWLEEVIGLAEAGGDGLELAKETYTKPLLRNADGQLVRFLRGGDRHRRDAAAAGRDGARLVADRLRERPAARSDEPGVQPVAAAIDPCRIQDRRPDGRPLFADAGGVRAERGAERDDEPVRPPHQTAVCG